MSKVLAATIGEFDEASELKKILVSHPSPVYA